MRTRTRSTALVTLAAAVAALAAVAGPAEPAVARPAPASATPARSGVRRPHRARYRAPVDAPVRDPFRAPACTWCPGNRGLEYATASGQEVVAAAGGLVTFAGTVADVRWVVVTHEDGLRTSYGHLESIVVAAGATVAAGEPVGAASSRLHFGVRRGDTYLDPAPLLAGGVPVPRLVPAGGAPPRWPRAW